MPLLAFTHAHVMYSHTPTQHHHPNSLHSSISPCTYVIHNCGRHCSPLFLCPCIIRQRDNIMGPFHAPHCPPHTFILNPVLLYFVEWCGLRREGFEFEEEILGASTALDKTNFILILWIWGHRTFDEPLLCLFSSLSLHMCVPLTQCVGTL